MTFESSHARASEPDMPHGDALDLATFARLPQAVRDAAYDNSAAAPASAAKYLGTLEASGQQLAANTPCQLDVAYGPGTRQRIDFFTAPETGRPTLVFIHGGYWQMRHKNTFRGIVGGALLQGLNASLIGYTLAPEATMTAIVAEVRTALAFVRDYALAQGADGRLLVAGWSAGAQLAALCLDEIGVVAGLGISGIYDLGPIRHTFLNQALALTDDEVRRFSPIALPASLRPFVIAHGLAELPALQAQSRAYAAWRDPVPGGLIGVPEADHFSVLDALAQPQGPALRGLLAYS